MGNALSRQADLALVPSNNSGAGNRTRKPGVKEVGPEIRIQWGGNGFASETESRFGKELHRKGIAFFANYQVILDTAWGWKVFYPDFLIRYRDRWVIVEVDGPHHDDPVVAGRDYEREHIFWMCGIPIIRFGARDCFHDPAGVVNRLLARLDVIPPLKGRGRVFLKLLL